MNTELFPFVPSDDESETHATAADSSRPVDESRDTPDADSPAAEFQDAEAPDLEAVPDDAEATAPLPAAGTWEGDLERLRARFPGTRDGTLFCVYKLEQDTEVTLREIRPEAELRSVSLGGRSLHAGKVLLGLEAPIKQRRRAETVDEPDDGNGADDSDSRTGSFSRFTGPREESRSPGRRRADPIAGLGADLGGDLEAVLRDAIESAAHERTETLRAAIRQAIDVLQSALDD